MFVINQGNFGVTARGIERVKALLAVQGEGSHTSPPTIPHHQQKRESSLPNNPNHAAEHLKHI